MPGEGDQSSGAEAESEVDYYRSGRGKRLLRRVWRGRADAGWRCRGGVVLVHGLGDHTGRYGEVARIFVRAGYVVAGVDFPGNGGSEGKRGAMGGVSEAHEVLDEIVGWLEREVPEGVRGMAAHSMGGFLGLLYILRRPGLFRFCWANGVLADPGWGQGALMRLVARALGPVLPNVTVGNGVTAPMCSHREEPRDPLSHRRVSIGLGASLMAAASELQEEIAGMDPGLMLLVTHGGDDPVCPVAITERLIAKAGAERKRFVNYPGVLHETFRDDGAEALFDDIERWLVEVEAATGGG